MLEYLQQQCLSYFLSQFNPSAATRSTKDVVRQYLLKDFSADKVNQFIDVRLSAFQQMLVEEFNLRFSDGRPLRFQIADRAGVGSVVRGYRAAKSKPEMKFQNALRRLSAHEFELLAAVILKSIGCQEAFFTPASHDQGVDAFGHQDIIAPMFYGTAHRLTWIAQAKHYKSAVVTSGDIRELVGSKELLLAKAFSTIDARYSELRLRHLAPIALVLITTDEVPTTVRRLAENSGVFIFASSDLFHFLKPLLTGATTSGLRQFLKKQKKTIATLS